MRLCQSATENLVVGIEEGDSVGVLQIATGVELRTDIEGINHAVAWKATRATGRRRRLRAKRKGKTLQLLYVIREARPTEKVGMSEAYCAWLRGSGGRGRLGHYGGAVDEHIPCHGVVGDPLEVVDNFDALSRRSSAARVGLYRNDARGVVGARDGVVACQWATRVAQALVLPHRTG